MNSSICCQYSGCIWGHDTLSLRRWDLTSSQISIWRTSTYRYVTLWWRLLRLNQTLEVTRYARIRICHGCFWCGEKNSSLGIIVWHHSAEPRDARQSLVMPNSDPRTVFSIRTSNPWNILIMYLSTYLSILQLFWVKDKKLCMNAVR